jgi:hypothetical protein
MIVIATSTSTSTSTSEYTIAITITITAYDSTIYHRYRRMSYISYTTITIWV